ncbi:helix-turn-helix transcriptional regulator [Streptomyces sp. NPDC051840]|uniref:helix-turn-helix domain-containing protein n=1 Tax=Streptomyces sp. NPDC051840 TaxID=3154752 RepID=UPI0034489A04
MATENGGDSSGGAGGGEPSPSDGLKAFGAVLKALREEVHLTQEQFAALVQYSVAYVAKIEQGKRFPPKDLMTRSEAVLGATASRVLTAAAGSLTRKVGLASWFLQWAAIEEEAITLCAYECRVVPGLLQPEPYIRAVFSSRLPPLTDEQLDTQVAARLERQHLLGDRGNTAFGFVIEESVVQRQTGGPDVTRALIDHLLATADLRNVELQVMPLRQPAHAGLDGSLYLAETPDHQWVGYTEGHDTSTLITQGHQVSSMLQRYGRMRSQALSPEASVSLLEQLRGAL